MVFAHKVLTDDEAYTLAFHLADHAHKGQVDKLGNDYFQHPVRVARSMDPDDIVGRIVAILHDVVEDTYVTLRNLRDEGFTDVVVDAVDAISKRRGESLDDYLGRVCQNEIAVRVKLKDIRDNSNPTRMSGLDPDVKQRLQNKYEYCMEVICENIKR